MNPRTARLLVVDDEDRVSAVLTLHLSRLGYASVATAKTSEAALAAFAADHFDLVLMDIDLNGTISGVDLANHIREEFGIPVVFVSGHLTTELLNGQELPAFAHVHKPIDRDHLAVAVNTALTFGHNARWHRVQAAVAIAIATQPDISSVLKQCAHALMRYLAVDVAQISILEREGAMLVVSSTSGVARRPGVDPTLEIRSDVVEELVRAREPAFTNDLAAEPRFESLREATGVRALASHPLTVEGVTVGVVILLSRNALPESTPSLLAPIADVVAVGIQRKQLELETRAQSEELGLMHSALSTVLSTNDWHLAGRLLLLGVIARTHARSGVFAVQAGGRGLEVLAAEGATSVSEALCNTVVTRAETVCQDGFLGVPLKSEGQVIGMIGVAGAGFQHVDQQRLESIAQLAGVMCQAYAIHRVRADLEAELRSAREKEARAMAQANAALQKANLDLEERVLERTRELEERARELASSNQDLERFAYVSSHDLQEPLRVVTSYVQLLARRYGDRLDADAHRFIGHAVTGVTRMQTLINDLLAFSRVGSQARVEKFTSMNEVCAKALDNLQTAIAESGARVTFDHLPPVSGDELQLVQLVQNLIANAIKFRTEEHPTVHVSGNLRDGECEFTVRDNGIGIEPQYFDRIFIIFQRLHGPTKYTGTGIGLAICKKIVERHGGRIWVTPADGRGTVFHFTLKAPTEVTTS